LKQFLNQAFALHPKEPRRPAPNIAVAIIRAKAQCAAGLTPSYFLFYETLETLMASGNVKWFNPTKGYGFIQPSDGGKDVFVHISAVERAGLSTLNEGQQVEYELVTNRGKTSAENLKVG
jgi:CspA family cold shock protein